MRMLLKSLAVAALSVAGLAGCGGNLEPEAEEPLATAEQSLYRCLYDGTMAGACPEGLTCVSGTCRTVCFGGSSSCSLGQKCCPGYQYSDGSLMNPYCISQSTPCYLPR